MSKENTMRDTQKELDEALKGFDGAISGMKHAVRTPVLINGVMSMIMICGWALTISTILWQWIG
jgi:hypothetical protein|tara:strand:+ start:2291 stop:2482 length:192 start_codon:yes stop_codon:yes gene_type:complete